MHEAAKTRAVRPLEFYVRFLSGRVIDIGCGKDLVLPNAEPFDLEHGDANDITRFRNEGTYDSVHSSHCLEHMYEPRHALLEWWKLIKPGGYLILVVPDMELYEQAIWPSIFNSDHKWMFSLSPYEQANLPILEIGKLVGELPNASVVQIERQDHLYNHSLMVRGASKIQRLLCRIIGKIRRGLYKDQRLAFLDQVIMRSANIFGVPVDQTIGNALAQIQVVLRKNAIADLSKRDDLVAEI